MDVMSPQEPLPATAGLDLGLTNGNPALCGAGAQHTANVDRN
jgi:hypothetical protein